MGARSANAAFPIAAICCLGLILLAIAATIILALIPIYTSAKTATLGPKNKVQRTLSYTVPLSNSANAGALNGAQNAQVTNFLSQNSQTSTTLANGGLTVTNAVVSGGTGRRRRQTTGQVLLLTILIFARDIGYLNAIQFLLNLYIQQHSAAISAYVANLLNSSSTTSALISTTPVAASTTPGGRRRRIIHLRRQAYRSALEPSNTYKD